jgi:putative sporulation protein YtaF
MAWLIILGFAVSSSLDNLGVGISYGIRSIRIGFVSNFIIALICFLFSEAGILFGQWFSRILPGILPVLVGTFLMIVIGIRIILLTIPRKQKRISNEVVANDKTANNFKGILKNPEIADADQSGEIGVGEAVILGIALSANAITNGLSAGLFGLSPLAISLTAAIGSFLTVWAGVALGRKAASIRIGRLTLGQFGTLLSGVIILAIACHTLL